jgi:hypothetical protein
MGFTMILNKRNGQEERLLRKLMVLVRTSNNSSIQTQEDLSNYIGIMFNELSFEERRDIILDWLQFKKDPIRAVRGVANELLELFVPEDDDP